MTFRELTPRDVAEYVASGEWQGRAGGYAIQGRGAALVERVEGDYLNVVGLPAPPCACSPSASPGYGHGCEDAAVNQAPNPCSGSVTLERAFDELSGAT